MTLQNETTPLLHRTPSGDHVSKSGKGRFRQALRKVFGVENRVLFAGFLITLSFSFTQVPLLYVFRVMLCDVYYDTHPPYEGDGDRCSINVINADTATQFSILGMSTTLCGTLNLFVTGWMAKKYGPRAAIIAQTFVPAIRVLTQSIGVVAGRREGIILIQATQLITILGGPAGYILVVNIIAGEVVEPAKRTAVFGQLQGTIMLGQGVGYIVGGELGDRLGIRAPFDTAFVFFLISTVYAILAMPYIDPSALSDGKKTDKGVIAAFLAPLKILVPQRLRFPDGRIKKHYGVIFLCSGIFIGVVATGYAPLLIQMYASGDLGFSQADNGWLMSGYAMMRALFLIFMFPKIISRGRRWMNPSTAPESAEPTDDAQLPTDPAEFDATVGEQADEEPVRPPAHDKTVDPHAFHFDLVFLRWSLVLDGALTTIAAFATQKWHIYLAAFLLPLGSGSAPAAKGVITDMCSRSQRTDALNAVTLVENIARLATQGLFGFVFATFANMGIAYATFFCNAAIAVLGMGVLLFSHFPPDDAKVVDHEKDEEEDERQEEA